MNIERTLQIRSWSGNKVAVDPGNISANAGFDYPRLIIPVKLEISPLKDYNDEIINLVVMNSKGNLYVENKNNKVSECLPIFYPYNVTAQGQWTTYNLEFPLDFKKTSKIEQIRKDDLNLFLDIGFTIGLYAQGTISFEYCAVEMQIQLEQSYWVKKILPGLSFGEYFIIEIPKGNRSISEAWERIEKAESCYKTWDAEGAFVNCREAGTLLQKTVELKLSGNPNLEKWKRAFSNFNHWVSLYMHIENIQPKIDINKSDAEHVLIITKALIKYAEELIREVEIKK